MKTTPLQYRHGSQGKRKQEEDKDIAEGEDFQLDAAFQRFTLHRFVNKEGHVYCNKFKDTCKRMVSVKEYKCYNCHLKQLEAEEGQQDG